LPQTHGGAYSAPPNPLAAFKGPTSNGRKGKGKGRDKGTEVRGGKGEMRGERMEQKGGEGLAYSRRLGPRKT